MTILVLHRSYGCDTGCCGHYIEVDGEERSFVFEHTYGRDPRAFAEELVRREMGDAHVADLDWEHCEVSDA